MALADHKAKSDSKQRLSKKEMRDACKNPLTQTKIKIKSRWLAPLKYKVLQTFQLNERDRKEVVKMLTTATTPEKAMKAIYLKPFWSYRSISLIKDFECGVLQFKNLGVCLFYKRQCSEIEPMPSEPVPIGALESDDDIWARLDLFSKSPRQLVSDARIELAELDMKVAELQHIVSSQANVIAALENELATLKQNKKAVIKSLNMCKSRK